MLVKKEHKYKQDPVQDHIKGAKGEGRQSPCPMGKYLKGIHAKCGEPKCSRGNA
jgi:hypothetical protein